jgi:hypothetical protein
MNSKLRSRIARFAFYCLAGPVWLMLIAGGLVVGCFASFRYGSKPPKNC